MEAIGPKLRRQRRRLGLTLDELAGRTGISKPYLSLIETGRVPNPPSDEKLRRLEQSLGFTPGELLTQAHLQRTPRDVRAVLSRLISQRKDENGGWKMAPDHGCLPFCPSFILHLPSSPPSSAFPIIPPCRILARRGIEPMRFGLIITAAAVYLAVLGCVIFPSESTAKNPGGSDVAAFKPAINGAPLTGLPYCRVSERVTPRPGFPSGQPT